MSEAPSAQAQTGLHFGAWPRDADDFSAEVPEVSKEEDSTKDNNEDGPDFVVYAAAC
jgi:hypothetical protein